MNPKSKIYVAGHSGMVGSAIIDRLKSLGYHNILKRLRSELDLSLQSDVDSFFQEELPDVVIMAAAKVGGIQANYTYPAEFLYENLAIATNTINAAFKANVSRFVFLGSSCIYPKLASQPMTEDSLLSGKLETTNEPYAIAKIAGLKLCEYYRKQYGVMFHSIMPCNLYGPRDRYHRENSHVLPALIRKFHEAKIARQSSVAIWGTGTPKRELMHVSDLADAVFKTLELENPPNLLNAGTGIEHSIMEIAEIVKRVVGFEGEITKDPGKPDGTPRKLLDSTLLREQGWSPKVSLEDGIKQTYTQYLQEIVSS